MLCTPRVELSENYNVVNFLNINTYELIRLLLFYNYSVSSKTIELMIVNQSIYCKRTPDNNRQHCIMKIGVKLQKVCLFSKNNKTKEQYIQLYPSDTTFIPYFIKN